MSTKSHGHILPLRVYLGIGAALLILTVITVAVSTVDLGPWNLAVAMVIAGIKASLVALFFMHLLYDNKLYLTIFVTSIAFLAVFIVFTMFDTLQRGQLEDFKAGPINKQAQMYENTQSGSDANAVADTVKHD
ncbi:cytochrome C oxidase subunit IV family protein [candidate division KSB1 bacterium]